MLLALSTSIKRVEGAVMSNLLTNIIGTLILVAATIPWLNIWGPEFTYWGLMVRLAGAS